MKNKKLLLIPLLIGLISCNVRPILNIGAAWIYEWDKLDPDSVNTDALYTDVAWGQALFNQYGSGLSYRVVVEAMGGIANFDVVRYAFTYTDSDNVAYRIPSADWEQLDTYTWSATLNTTWQQRVNSALFDRAFSDTTKMPINRPRINMEWLKYGGDPFNYRIRLEIRSFIDFNVNIGAALLGFATIGSDYSTSIGIVDQKNIGMRFYRDDQLLQNILLFHKDLTTFPSNAPIRMYLFELPTLLTAVNRFDLVFEMYDGTPLSTANYWSIRVNEFNLFATTDVYIPNIESEDTIFGISYQVVEWWNILGHFNNFIWWILNESFLSSIFTFIYKAIIVPIGLFFQWFFALFGG